MNRIKVSEATSTQLDWLVAKCEGHENTWLSRWTAGGDRRFVYCEVVYSYTTNWSQMGPIIERERLDLRAKINAGSDIDEWRADIGIGAKSRGRYGPTPLIAAARCYVASKLGEEVEVPEELM